MGVINRFIKKQPNFIQKLYYNIVPFKWRYGKVYRETLDELNMLNGVDSAGKDIYHRLKLITFLRYVYESVPYYTKLFDEHNIDVYNNYDVRALMKRIPILTKELINENFNDLISTTYKPKKIVEFKTSGSTGQKLKFLGDDDMFKKEAAYIERAFNAHGTSLYTKKTIWLRRFSPTQGDKLWYTDYEMNRLYMSAFHLSEQTIKAYVDTINESKIDTLVGYPSSVFILCLLLDEYKLKLTHIKYVHVASEKLLYEWKVFSEKVLGCEVKAHYGQMEKVSMFYQGSGSDNYIEPFGYGYTEFEPNAAGSMDIIATGFMNKYMPFIRYKMNDTAILSDDPEAPVADFDGRSDDLLLAENGSLVPSVNFYTMFYKINGVKLFQLIQKQKGTLDVKIVTDKSFKNSDIDVIINELRRRLGTLNVNLQVVSSIPRDNNTGKIRCIKNEIKNLYRKS